MFWKPFFRLKIFVELMFWNENLLDPTSILDPNFWSAHFSAMDKIFAYQCLKIRRKPGEIER